MLDFFISSANAQDAAAGQPGGFASFIPFVLIFGIFYFLMIRPQKKRIDEENAMLATIGKGDEIFTKSGILGTIVGMTDKVITLEVGEGVKFKVLKSQIGGMAKKIFETKEEKKETPAVEKK
ncbi:MAG: preprotein translocase subunit YajC [Bacteriovoracaceae bacterium]|nr:preprotein translocase subunit YajC [Bacteriovoracaceae bacterium]